MQFKKKKKKEEEEEEEEEEEKKENLTNLQLNTKERNSVASGGSEGILSSHIESLFGITYF